MNSRCDLYLRFGIDLLAAGDEFSVQPFVAGVKNQFGHIATTFVRRTESPIAIGFATLHRVGSCHDDPLLGKSQHGLGIPELRIIGRFDLTPA